MAPPEPRPTEIEYPETDHRPMAESDLHRILMTQSIAALGFYFQREPDVYVTGNLLVYYVEGRPDLSVAPDVFVVKGVPCGQRRVYKTWEEKSPDVVLELTSRSSHHEDFVEKRALYERLGVKEYFIFDPKVRRSRPQAAGFRLQGGVFRRLSESRIEGRMQVFYSEVLGLELHGGGSSLRWVDPRTAQPLPIPDELFQRLQEEMARAEAERATAEAERARADAERARAEAERARAETERARADAERETAEAERAKADAERATAKAERLRADTAEAEAARLREELSRLRGGKG